MQFIKYVMKIMTGPLQREPNCVPWNDDDGLLGQRNRFIRRDFGFWVRLIAYIESMAAVRR